MTFDSDIDTWHCIATCHTRDMTCDNFFSKKNLDKIKIKFKKSHTT